MEIVITTSAQPPATGLTCLRPFFQNDLDLYLSEEVVDVERNVGTRTRQVSVALLTRIVVRFDP